MLRRWLAALLAALLTLALCGCAAGPRHKIIYKDGEFGFSGARDEYAAGEKVVLYYDLIATDTDYSFSVEGAEADISYEDSKGYILTFVMPDHDVTVSVEWENTMLPQNLEPDGDLEDIGEDDVLFDYYEATVATVGGDGYDEFVLYAYRGDLLRLAKYAKWGDSDETREVRAVPDAALEDCMAAVEKHGMADWPGKGGSGMLGKVLVVKFLRDGELLRISSDEMPIDGGRAAFDEIRQILIDYWSDAAGTAEQE